MPYIKKEYRKFYDVIFSDFPSIDSKGELEYCIFSLMKRYMAARQYKYTDLHDTVYAAQHCADEFRRRYLDKREDEAIVENGDI